MSANVFLNPESSVLRITNPRTTLEPWFASRVVTFERHNGTDDRSFVANVPRDDDRGTIAVLLFWDEVSIVNV